MPYHLYSSYQFSSKIKSFQLLTELQAYQVIGKENPKPKSLTGIEGIGAFYVGLVWLIPLLGIAFFLFKKMKLR